jgi:transcriptional regulator with XRE-family HTH domain
MRSARLLERVRRAAGLSQEELARRAGTSRPTLSAYEHGRKSPTLATLERLLAEAGHELSAEPRVTFTEHVGPRTRPVVVPDRLPRLPLADALATITLPVHLCWSTPRCTFDLSDRRQRARAYEIVLREGGPDDIRRYIDGALLLDLWPELVLPRRVREAWEPIVKAAA